MQKKIQKRFYLGLDLGQVRDPTALTLTECIEGESEAPNRYICQKLKRMRGVPYHLIVDHVAMVMNQPELKDNTELVVDGTGVGRGVVDDLRKAGLSPCAISIRGGTGMTKSDGYFNVAKIELVTVMQILLQSGRLVIDKSEPDAAVLEAELLNFKATITKAGNETFAAGSAPDWREGAHDDLVLSLAVALWRAEYLARAERNTYIAPKPQPQIILDTVESYFS